MMNGVLSDYTFYLVVIVAACVHISIETREVR
jgi:hypothetical protein